MRMMFLASSSDVDELNASAASLETCCHGRNSAMEIFSVCPLKVPSVNQVERVQAFAHGSHQLIAFPRSL